MQTPQPQQISFDENFFMKGGVTRNTFLVLIEINCGFFILENSLRPFCSFGKLHIWKSDVFFTLFPLINFY